MAYLGNDLQVAFPVYRNIDDISGSFNSSTTSFPLRVSGVAPVPAPLYSQQCLISVGGVVQRPDDSGSEGFRLNGGNIIFASAPTTGADFFGVILAGADYVNAGGNFPSGTAGVPSITFNDDLDTGIYNSGVNQLSFTTAGTERFRIGASGQIGLNGASYGTNGQVLTSSGAGSAPTWQTLASSGDVFLASNNAFTGANTFTNTTGQTFRQAATQDGLLIRGRAGGTSSYTAEVVPTTLTASRTITLPDATGTVALLGTAQTFTAVQTLTDPAIIGTILEDVFTITDGAAFEIDPSNGSVQLITLGANRTPKATNFAAGEAITLMVDDGSAFTLTWSDATFGGSGVVWKTGGGSAPTLNTTGYTVIVLWKVGTQVYGARVGDA